MGYLIFRGVNTQSLDRVYVSQMPSHKKAAMRHTEYYVKGRDGALHVDEGYSNFKLSVVLTLLDSNVSGRQVVNAWADGTGKLITSDDLTHAYMASVKDEIRWVRIKSASSFYDTATITFDCEPYMYEAVDSVYEFTESGVILNPASAEALPMIVVEGSGDTTFTIAGQEITIDGMTSGVPVNIDCSSNYVYTESGATTIHGNFPSLPIGESEIDFGTGVSKITITPHWRWV